jgi:hypothetical protein
MPTISFIYDIQGASAPDSRPPEGLPARTNSTPTPDLRQLTQPWPLLLSHIAHAKGDTTFALNYAIGEMRLSAGGDSEIFIILLEDTLALSDIQEAPQMALAAGFQSVPVFVYSKGTGTWPNSSSARSSNTQGRESARRKPLLPHLNRFPPASSQERRPPRSSPESGSATAETRSSPPRRQSH